MAQGVVLPVQDLPDPNGVTAPAADTTQAIIQKTTDHPIWQQFLATIAAKPEDFVMWFLLICLLTTFTGLVWSWHRSKKNNFDLEDLVCIEGKLNESKMNRFVAFVISTWGFIYLLVTKQFTEWFFMGYMGAWVSNALLATYLRQRDKEIDQDYQIELAKAQSGATTTPPPTPDITITTDTIKQ